MEGKKGRALPNIKKERRVICQHMIRMYRYLIANLGLALKSPPHKLEWFQLFELLDEHASELARVEYLTEEESATLSNLAMRWRTECTTAGQQHFTKDLTVLRSWLKKWTECLPPQKSHED